MQNPDKPKVYQGFLFSMTTQPHHFPPPNLPRWEEELKATFFIPQL
jgi:hypothetical protein